MPRKPRETTHLRVRVEPKLLARLERAREKSGRTLTREITERLEQSFVRDDQRDLIKNTVNEVFTRIDAANPFPKPRKREPLSYSAYAPKADEEGSPYGTSTPPLEEGEKK